MKLSTIAGVLGVLFANLAFAEAIKNARVEGGVLIVDGKTYTIDTTTQQGKELAAKMGNFDVSGRIDKTTMKIVVDNHVMAKPTTSAPGKPAPLPNQ